MSSVHGEYMGFDEEEDEHVGTDNDHKVNIEESDSDLELPEPQWPQSYRQSMDIYSHMPSPSFTFLSPNASRSSVLSSSLGKHYDSATSILDPLLREEEKEEEDEEEARDSVKFSDIKEPIKEPVKEPMDIPSPQIVKVASDTRLRKTSSVKFAPEVSHECHVKLPEGGCTFFQATLNGINVLAGVGVLSTPYALKQGGWIGVLILLLFAVVCCYTGILLRRCLESGPGLVTYPDIGQAAFGRTGRLIVSILLYTELYACCVEFLILEGDNLASLFPNAHFGNFDPHKVFTIIAALFILPTVWLRDLSLLAYISAGGVLTSIIVVLSVLWIGTVDNVGFHHSGPLINLGNIPVAVGLLGFCFSGHAVFPNIYSSMKSKAQFNHVLQLCFALCILMYGGVAVMGFTMFGAETASQVTLNLPNQFAASKLALCTTVITPLTKYALTITPVALSLEELLPNHFTWKNHWASVAIRTCLVASTLIVAIVIPFFGFVMAFIGSFLSLTGSLILPCACYLSIQRRRITLSQAIICIGTIIIGFVAAVAGTYSSVSGIVGQFKTPNHG